MYIKIIKIEDTTNRKAKNIFLKEIIIKITQTFIKNLINGGIPAIDKQIKNKKSLSIWFIWFVFKESFLEKL